MTNGQAVAELMTKVCGREPTPFEVYLVAVVLGAFTDVRVSDEYAGPPLEEVVRS